MHTSSIALIVLLTISWIVIDLFDSALCDLEVDSMELDVDCTLVLQRSCFSFVGSRLTLLVENQQVTVPIKSALTLALT